MRKVEVLQESFSWPLGPLFHLAVLLVPDLEFLTLLFSAGIPEIDSEILDRSDVSSVERFFLLLELAIFVLLHSG